jgi:hypothetical protein
LFILWRSISIQNSMFPCWLVQVLHPSQTFERPPFWNGWSYGIKKYSDKVTFNGMTSLLNFIKIYQLIQKLLGGHTDGQTDRQTDYLISFTFLFKESRLKNVKAYTYVAHLILPTASCTTCYKHNIKSRIWGSHGGEYIHSWQAILGITINRYNWTGSREMSEYLITLRLFN